MTEQEKQKKKDELDKEILLALLVAFSVEAEVQAATNEEKSSLETGKFPDHVKDEVKQWENYPDLRRIREAYAEHLDKETELNLGAFKKNTKAAIQAAVVKILTVAHQTEYFKVTGIDDENQCEACRAIQGKIYTRSGNDPRYPKIDQFLTDEGLHPNCRCYLRETKAPKFTTKDLTKMAMNSTNLTDEVLYTSLVDDNSLSNNGEQDDIPTYDFGESLVQIAPVGIFQGTAPDGSPMEEKITKEALDEVLFNYDGSELLLDVDHRSMRAMESDTKAAGWIYDLKVVDGLGRLDGLYGRIRWTDYGRRLIETREYRFISPVFKVEGGMPFALVNAGLTNRPALETIMPILNSKADNDGGTTVIMKTDNKEDEKKLDETKVENSATTQKTEPEKKEGEDTDGEDTKETKPAEVTNPATTQNTCSDDDKKETQNTETTQNTCGDDDKKPVENACSDDKDMDDKDDEDTDGDDKDGDDKDDTPTQNTATTQNTEAPTEVTSTVEKKVEEVISLEVLNQAPEKKVEQTVTENDKLKKALSLKGKAFFDYLKANPELR